MERRCPGKISDGLGPEALRGQVWRDRVGRSGQSNVATDMLCSGNWKQGFAIFGAGSVAMDDRASLVCESLSDAGDVGRHVGRGRLTLEQQVIPTGLVEGGGISEEASSPFAA